MPNIRIGFRIGRVATGFLRKGFEKRFQPVGVVFFRRQKVQVGCIERRGRGVGVGRVGLRMGRSAS